MQDGEKKQCICVKKQHKSIPPLFHMFFALPDPNIYRLWSPNENAQCTWKVEKKENVDYGKKTGEEGRCKEEKGREMFGEGYQREEEKDRKESQMEKSKITG